MTKDDIVTAVSKMPVETVWRHMKSIAAAVTLMWVTLWWIGGDVMRAKAEDALLQALGRLGMAPKDFTQMKSNLDQMRGDVVELKKTTESLEGTVQDASRHLDSIQTQLDGMKLETERTNRLLGTLIPMLKTEATTKQQ